VKALLRFAKRNPREGKLRRGSGGTRSKQPRVATDSRGEESPEGGRRFLRPWVKLGQERQAQPARGQRRATSSCGSVGGETPEERTPDVAVGRNKPTKVAGGGSRRGREKRRGRNEAGLGSLRRSGEGNRAEARVDSSGRCREGGRNPKEGARRREATGGPGSKNSGGERSAREDEPTMQIVGDGGEGSPRRSARKGQGQGGIGQPNRPGTSSQKHSGAHVTP
jgi:hypothetical protein